MQQFSAKPSVNEMETHLTCIFHLLHENLTVKAILCALRHHTQPFIHQQSDGNISGGKMHILEYSHETLLQTQLMTVTVCRSYGRQLQWSIHSEINTL